MSKKEVVIYWAPLSGFLKEDWNMLYYEPENLFNSLKNNTISGNKKDSFFVCPAVSSKFKKTYILNNTLDSKFNFKEDGTVDALHNDEAYIGMRSLRKSPLKKSNMLQYNMQWIFFAEEPLLADFLPPYFHKPKYTNYGTVMPGSFDIGSWFRAYNAEFITWESEGFFQILENEPIAYVHFNTEKNIVLKRFIVNDKIKKYADACSNSPSTIGKNIPLVDRYSRFKKSSMNKIILNEIKKNLVDND